MMKKGITVLLPLLILSVVLASCLAITPDRNETPTPEATATIEPSPPLEEKAATATNTATVTPEPTANPQNSDNTGDPMPTAEATTYAFDPNFYIFLCFGQ